ncbi:5-dehydro-2-deoxygluconokinase [Roseibium denhamense]|uniref:5-dehydro-2-deoxygluconokinase n=1 Tax=Roseibium denhamense TaxID=76305 RepID=A0ABY1NBZ8_9HYPH|nr:5-dehydro-2-deoxygluconokinase [Roseibium denhamense]MTI06635.1 5-dehydro-2-deoxygluconokinase [Roseibium denhamense]SMP05922.1 5-dehydro-2-deoxygluconokinase [Roseibium denhamense]
MLLEAIAKNNFVVVGRAGIDFYTDAGVRAEDAQRISVGLGGSAANIGAGICKLGGKAALVTRVSDDSVGSYCIGQLKHYGVDTTHVTPVGGEYRNSLAFYESVVEGHRNVIYRNGAADFQMDDADVASVDYTSYSALITAGTVFAAEPSRSAAFQAFELAKAAGLPLIFDVDYRPYSWPSPEVAAEVLSRAAAQCEMIVGNDVEFGFMAGGYDKGLDKARELVRTTAELVIYKMGEDGAITITREGEFKTGIYPVEALKPNGAGDSFMSGLVTSIADGFSLKDAVLRGSACASIVVAKPGCAPAMPDKTELEAFLASHPGPTPA